MESNISTNTSHGHQTYHCQSKQSQSDERTGTSTSSTMTTHSHQQTGITLLFD